ncbi:unnamed protein product [Thlaspi arvense]|uniref:Uncharacterized protein n=1 Tax=Thlaspi arvense TaxID=13288 RepID=A0AAU9T2F5_THLAR|nr:unnamed protein product [Thlaspi arvense]
MVNTCRISFISMVILLLFINQSALSSSVRIRLIEGRVLVNEKQRDRPTYDEIEKADRARLDYLFSRMIEAETNLLEVDSRPLSTMDLVTNRIPSY